MSPSSFSAANAQEKLAIASGLSDEAQRGWGIGARAWLPLSLPLSAAAQVGATSWWRDGPDEWLASGVERLRTALARWERVVAALRACAPELRLRTAYRGVLLAHLLVRAGHGWPPLPPPQPSSPEASLPGCAAGAGPAPSLLAPAEAAFSVPPS